MKDSIAKSLEEVHGSVNTEKKGFWGRLLAFVGPAYLISVGYMDPGNWATDIAAGSRYGYALIWVLLLSNLMAVLLQSLSARLGIVSGRDLAQASRETSGSASWWKCSLPGRRWSPWHKASCRRSRMNRLSIL